MGSNPTGRAIFSTFSLFIFTTLQIHNHNTLWVPPTLPITVIRKSIIKPNCPHLSLYLWIFSLSSATMAASTFPLRSSRALQNPLLSPFLSSHSHLNPTPRPLLSFPFRLRPKTGVKLPNGPPRSFKIFSVRESNGTFDPASLLHCCSFMFVDLICFNFAFRFLFCSLIDSAYVYFTNCFYGRFCVAE